MARAAAVLIESDKVALIKRERQGRVYYLFPGGTVEQGESLEEACVREIHEELGLDVETGPMLAEVIFEETPQYYYLCRIRGGIFGTGDGEEYCGSLPPERGTYQPVWMQANQLLQNPVQPKCVCELIMAIMEGRAAAGRRFRDYGNGVCEPIEGEV